MKNLILLHALLIFFISSLHADWEKINSFPTTWVNDIYISTGVIYAASPNTGIYRSTDGTVTWQQMNNGLNNQQAIQCKQIIISGGIFYTATVDGIYKSTDAGANWIKKSTGIFVGNGALYAFTESIYELNGVLYTGAYSGLYRSTDNAESWVATNITGTHICAKNFTMHNGTIFAARESGNLPNGYFSTNSGVTWQNLTSLNFPSITFLSEGSNLFAGTIHGAWLSTNNGVSWMERAQGLTPDPYNSSFVRVKGILISSLKFGGSGMYKTSNDGVLWENFGQGLPFLTEIGDLAIFNNKILT